MKKNHDTASLKGGAGPALCLRKKKKFCETICVYLQYMVARSNLLSKKNGWESHQTIPLKSWVLSQCQPPLGLGKCGAACWDVRAGEGQQPGTSSDPYSVSVSHTEPFWGCTFQSCLCLLWECFTSCCTWCNWPCQAWNSQPQRWIHPPTEWGWDGCNSWTFAGQVPPARLWLRNWRNDGAVWWCTLRTACWSWLSHLAKLQHKGCQCDICVSHFSSNYWIRIQEEKTFKRNLKAHIRKWSNLSLCERKDRRGKKSKNIFIKGQCPNIFDLFCLKVLNWQKRIRKLFCLAKIFNGLVQNLRICVVNNYTHTQFFPWLRICSLVFCDDAKSNSVPLRICYIPFFGLWSFL